MSRLLLTFILSLSISGLAFAQSNKDKKDTKKPVSTVRAAHAPEGEGSILFMSDDQKTFLKFGGYMSLLGEAPTTKLSDSSLTMKYFRLLFTGQAYDKLSYTARLDYRMTVYSSGKEAAAADAQAPGAYFGRAYGTYAFTDSLKLSLGRIDNDLRITALTESYIAGVGLGARLDKTGKGINYSLVALQFDPAKLEFQPVKDGGANIIGMKGKTTKADYNYMLSAKLGNTFVLGKEVSLNTAVGITSRLGTLDSKEKVLQSSLEFLLTLPKDWSILSQSVFQKRGGSDIESLFYVDKTFENRNAIGVYSKYNQGAGESNITAGIEKTFALIKGKDKDDVPLTFTLGFEWENINKGWKNSGRAFAGELFFWF